MARIRTIKPQFFTSEEVTALEPLARLLFIGLFTECDREGRVEDRPRTLKMRLLPADDCDVDVLLWSLVDARLIRRYEANGVQVIQVIGFSKHQRPHPKEQASLLPADGIDRVRPFDTACREKVVMLPVDNPSSPVGREGKEYGVQEGKGREGEGTAQRTPTLIARGEGVNWFKRHGNHVEGFCDWVCFDQAQMDELAAKIPGDDLHQKRMQLRVWASSVRKTWADRIIPDGSNYDFWRNRWTEQHGGSRPANATLRATRAAADLDEAFR